MGRGQRPDAAGKCILEGLHRIGIGGRPRADRLNQGKGVLHAVVEFAHQQSLLLFSRLALREVDHRNDGTADPVAGNP